MMHNIKDKINSSVHSITAKARIFVLAFRGSKLQKATFKARILKQKLFPLL